MGTRGSWCRINYDGGDIGAIVRGGSEGAVIYSNPFDFDNLFTGSEVPVEHNGCEEIVPFSSIIKEDPENVCSTASSPGASEYKTYTPRSPKREFDHSSSPKEIEVKTEANDQSPSKICPSPKLPGIKKRKSQQRSMVCIPMVEGSWNKQGGAGVASDLWSWRKYGQKPIKGSPYPRGYYRCSSSKGCPARKQVERSRTDPTMLLITYTADHNHTSPAHRRALARSSVHDNSFSPHDKKENTFSLSLQKPLSLSDPDAAIATDHHHDNLSPPNNLSSEHDHQEDINNNNNSILDNSLFEDDQQHLSPNNHIFHEDLFESFGDFSSVFQRDFMTRCSDEEDYCTMVDPFNLFDWSFSTNEWPNSNSSC